MVAPYTRRAASRSLFLTLIATLAFTAQAAPTVTTLAGTGVKGFSGDGGPAAIAQLNNPFGLTRNPADGALYLCDCDNGCVRKIDKAGIITTVAGTPGKKGYAGDGGPAAKALMNEPYELRFDKAGQLFVVERLNHCVRQIDLKAGTISTLAGTGEPGFAGDGGPAAKAQFNQPHSIAFGPGDKDGAADLYVCDILNHRIRRIDMKTRTISTFAGTGQKLSTPDNAPLNTAPLFGPRGVDFDPNGTSAYLALREGNAVLRIDLKTGTLHPVAGTGKKGFTARPLPARTATLNGPKGLAIGPTGNVYVADTEAHAIRMLDLGTGDLTLVAGTGEKSHTFNANPLQCGLARPHGLFVDPADGAIYVGDSENHRVLVIRER